MGDPCYGQRDLLGNPQQKLSRLEALRRLRCAAIDDPHEDVAIQMYINAKLNGLGFDRADGAFRDPRRLLLDLCFGSFALVRIIHRGSGVVVFPAPDHPMLSSPSPKKLLI